MRRPAASIADAHFLVACRLVKLECRDHDCLRQVAETSRVAHCRKLYVAVAAGQTLEDLRDLVRGWTPHVARLGWPLAQFTRGVEVRVVVFVEPILADAEL